MRAKVPPFLPDPCGFQRALGVVAWRQALGLAFRQVRNVSICRRARQSSLPGALPSQLACHDPALPGRRVFISGTHGQAPSSTPLWSPVVNTISSDSFARPAYGAGPYASRISRTAFPSHSSPGSIPRKAHAVANVSSMPMRRRRSCVRSKSLRTPGPDAIQGIK